MTIQKQVKKAKEILDKDPKNFDYPNKTDWSIADDVTLKDMYQEACIEEIAEAFHCSAHSISDRLSQMGLRTAKSITAKDIELYNACIKAGFNREELKEKFGLTPSSRGTMPDHKALISKLHDIGCSDYVENLELDF